MTIKRSKLYEDILYKQDKYVEDFLKQKKIKKTILESIYLYFFWKKEFDDVYLSFSWWRKVFFTCKELIYLAKKYDKAEMQFAKDWNKDEFFEFFQGFIKEFDDIVDGYFKNLYEHYSYWRYFLNVRRYFANEAKKLIFIILDSDTDEWNYFAYKLAEYLAKNHRKVAFSVYEKSAKQIVKSKEIKYSCVKWFVTSYLTIQPDLKANYNIKILKIFWANLSKFVWNPPKRTNLDCIKMIEWLYS